MDNEKTLIKLVNPEFGFEFMGKSYRLRQATLDKAVQYQQKVKELQGDPSADAKLVSFCIYIMLKDQEVDLNEDIVMQNTPANIDSLELLTELGFINPSRLALAKKATQKVLSRLNIEDSSPSSPNEPDGLQIKSEA